MSEEEGKDMEGRIIEAAKAVFVRKGFEATKMGDIATEAGISRTSLHYYFRNKETLFQGILAQLLNNFIPDLETIMEEEGTLRDKLPRVIHAYMSVIRENSHLPLFFLNEIRRDPEHIYAAVIQNNDRIPVILKFRQQISDEMESGKIRKIPLVDLLSTVVGLVVFPFLARIPFTQALLDGDENEFEKFLDRREDFIVGIVDHLLAPETSC